MQQFETLNRQQQPFIQSGYGALGKLNTLLGIGSRPGAAPVGGGSPAPMGLVPRIANSILPGDQPINMPRYRPTPGGGVEPIIGGPASGGSDMHMRLRQILMLRAQNGDSQAARILGAI